jgi:hypothetical protein
MDILKYNVASQNSLKRRGYKYTTPDELVDNKNDPELLIPKFEDTMESLAVNTPESLQNMRTAIASCIQRFFNRCVFIPSKINKQCFAIELVDRVLMSLSELPNISELQVIVGACVYLSHATFAKRTNRKDWVSFITKTFNVFKEETLSETIDLLLERFKRDITYTYSVIWFVDWLGGPVYSKRLEQEVYQLYVSGEYRSKDPYTLACEVILSI